MFESQPCANAARALGARPAATAGSRTGRSESRIVRIPRYVRYAAPANFTTVNASALVARMSERPSADAVACTGSPAQMPRLEERGAPPIEQRDLGDERHVGAGQDRQKHGDTREREDRAVERHFVFVGSPVFMNAMTRRHASSHASLWSLNVRSKNE